MDRIALREAAAGRCAIPGRTLPIGAAYLLGQHSDEVLAEWLGLDRDALGKPRTDAVIGGS